MIVDVFLVMALAFSIDFLLVEYYASVQEDRIMAASIYSVALGACAGISIQKYTEQKWLLYIQLSGYALGTCTSMLWRRHRRRKQEAIDADG